MLPIKLALKLDNNVQSQRFNKEVKVISATAVDNQVRSFEDDNVFMDHQARSYLPKALGQIKNAVTDFVNKLGLPFCNNKKRIE